MNTFHNQVTFIKKQIHVMQQRCSVVDFCCSFFIFLKYKICPWQAAICRIRENLKSCGKFVIK